MAELAPQTPSAEPKNKHEPWCNIWTTIDKKCNCGGKK